MNVLNDIRSNANYLLGWCQSESYWTKVLHDTVDQNILLETRVGLAQSGQLLLGGNELFCGQRKF